jgi:uncharacterized protein YbbK (DUF523 family)
MFQRLMSTSSGLKFVYIGRFAGNLTRTTGRIARCLSFGRKFFLHFQERNLKFEEPSVVISKNL